MTRNEVVERLGTIFKDIFDDSNLIIAESLSPNKVDAWDSINHINILHAVQKEFQIQFKLDELHKLNDFKLIVDAIVKKLMDNS